MPYRNPSSFVRVMENLFYFLRSQDWRGGEERVIIHAIFKCYLEILRRELYFVREGLAELELPREDKKNLRKLVYSCKISLGQRFQIIRMKIKILSFRIIFYVYPLTSDKI